MKGISWVILSGIICLYLVSSGAFAQNTSSIQGWYVIHCNVYGAEVYFDNTHVGNVLSGTLSVPSSSSAGIPYSTYSVEMGGYQTYTGNLPPIPANGASVDLYVTLNPIPIPTPTTPVPVSSLGWYQIHCNIDGATVLFDGMVKGQTQQGSIYVPALTTGTPYHNFTVEKTGYTTYVSDISSVPLAGQILEFYVALVPAATPVSTIQGSFGSDTGWFVVHSNVDNATVYFDADVMGQTAQGVLAVPVNVSGTPYHAFSVTKEGYMTYGAPITVYPAAGGSVDLNVTLKPALSSTITKSPFPSGVVVFAILMGSMIYIVTRRRAH
jgi:hypothetical protein